jgi:hypothetical protein
MNETDNEAAWVRWAKAGDLETFEALTKQREFWKGWDTNTSASWTVVWSRGLSKN